MNTQEQKYIDIFASLMIEKIKKVEGDWKKPWFNPNIPFVRNVNGYTYNGSNEMLLRLISESNNLPPIFTTFNQAKELGFSVMKGKQGIPTILWKKTYYSEEELKKIASEIGVENPEDLKEEDKVKSMVKKYNVVFNINDTNIKDVKPELYDKLMKSIEENKPKTTNVVDIPEIDKMIEENSWICPINIKESNKAYFAPSEKFIVVPMKEQFPNQEHFYGTLLHEMAHSTMIEHPRKELDYAHEELVAELSSAYSLAQLGIGKTIKEHNAQYLKSWVSHIANNPEVILDITKHVTKAIGLINIYVNPKMSVILENNNNIIEENKKKEPKKKNNIKNNKKRKGFRL